MRGGNPASPAPKTMKNPTHKLNSRNTPHWLRRGVKLLAEIKQSPVHLGVLIIVCIAFIVAMCVMLRMPEKQNSQTETQSPGPKHTGNSNAAEPYYPSR